ncbi:hypothetical protein JCM10908_002765 [Rhodotorula pacifica]|uniref:uncharacterized protein n=1 Tax=Rhodotorula pacifica TaxID=1495444 RepID=UPI0031821C74
MLSSTPALLLFAALFAPSHALAQSPLDSAPMRQLPFDSRSQPPRVDASYQLRKEVARPANPSVVVHIVDPSAPSTSFIAVPATPSTVAAAAEEAVDEDDEEEEQDDDNSPAFHQTDSPNFGRVCDFSAGAFLSCGDYFDAESKIDHGLFCSPAGVCAGKGAVCGATEACAQGLVCDLENNRCAEPTAKLLGIETARRSSRRESAVARCPHNAEACPTGHGGFECVYTLTDDAECGACRGMGGRDCAKIEHALATSCRKGACVVHACIEGFLPSADGIECIDALL